MRNDFEILTSFLEKFGDEVEGREFAELTPEIRARLRAFARGELPPAEQGELIRRLNQNPEWVARLAAEVKALRRDSTENR